MTKGPKEGDRGRGMCAGCRRVVHLQFVRGEIKMPFSDVRIQDVVVGVCPHCGVTVSIPSTATPRILEALRSVA